VGPFEFAWVLPSRWNLALWQHAEKESKEKALQKEARAET